MVSLVRCSAILLNRAYADIAQSERALSFQVSRCEFDPRYPLHRLMGIKAATSFHPIQKHCREFIGQPSLELRSIRRHSQAVRHGILTPIFGGSNPSVAASLVSSARHPICYCRCWYRRQIYGLSLVVERRSPKPLTVVRFHQPVPARERKITVDKKEKAV